MAVCFKMSWMLDENGHGIMYSLENSWHALCNAKVSLKLFLPRNILL